ncbi:hypothetical protein Clacol_001293 [Clathrus columnatus]|uniref:RNA helicase n=1 Tax=Clathrus columnatus TaxID=1419009 RepID=A0AAV4ZXZ9_9AGAM|nr:hypothetical protein Clacol_001293 [Clathrus columnatus]
MKRKALTSDELMRRLENQTAKKQKLDDISAEESDESGTEVEGIEAKQKDDDIDSNSDNSSEEEREDSEGDNLPKTIYVQEQEPISRLKPGLGSRISKDSTPQIAERHKDFWSVGIADNLVASMNSISIRRPTPVQIACIPALLQGNAKTGSGKTVAFALPILQKLSQDPYGIFALVLTPTRELAFQIADQFKVLGPSINLHAAIIVGGMDMMAQAIELGNRPHVVIATPGRLVDLLKSSNNEWDLSRIKFLILDEADRLLTETFSDDLSYLFNVIPKDRQTGLFTATLTPAIEALAEAPPRPGKQKPFIYRMESSSAPPQPMKKTFHKKGNKPVKKEGQKKKPSEGDDTPEQPPPTIIFCRRAYTAAYLTHLLQELSIRATSLHSRLTQRERLNSLSLFRSYVVPVLVCTDVAARGLDIEDVAMVINWDLPDEPEQYTHRVGRTARKGKGGVAVSFVTERDEERVINIERRINTKLTEMTLPETKVLEKLNAVSTAKRLANMELHDSDFGKREKIHKLKQNRREKKSRSS